MRERDVEKYLHTRITAIGGTTRKWTSPGHVGVPDRIVFLNGRVIFCEMKTDTGKLSVRQEREIETLRSHGADVRVISGQDGVKQFIAELQQFIDEILEGVE